MVDFFNLSISNLSASGFKIAKSTILAKDDVSVLDAFFKSVFFFFFAYLDKSNSSLTYPKDFGSGKYSLIYIMSFLSIQLLNELS